MHPSQHTHVRLSQNPKMRDFLGGPHNRVSSILGSILGSPMHGKGHISIWRLVPSLLWPSSNDKRILDSLHCRSGIMIHEDLAARHLRHYRV